MLVYTEELERAVEEHPDQYFWPIENIDRVAGSMRLAIERSSFNKDSPAFKATCKRLGIGHTYKAIAHYIANHT